MRSRAILRVAAGFTLAAACVWMLPLLVIWLRESDSAEALALRLPGRVLDVGGHPVHIVEMGQGPALLLVHGFGASTYDWEQHVLAPLAQHHRAIAVDLFGMGASERRADFDPLFSSYAAQLVGVLDALGIERASVAGHSMGGAIASVLAAQHPERVERLVLIAALAPAQLSEVPLVFRALRTPLLGEIALSLTSDLAPPGASPDYAARMTEIARVHGTRAAQLRYVRRRGKFEELEAAYPALRAPVLWVYGDADASVSRASTERALQAIPHVEAILLEGRGHFLLWEAPERVSAEVERFLGSGADRDVAIDRH